MEAAQVHALGPLQLHLCRDRTSSPAPPAKILTMSSSRERLDSADVDSNDDGDIKGLVAVVSKIPSQSLQRSVYQAHKLYSLLHLFSTSVLYSIAGPTFLRAVDDNYSPMAIQIQAILYCRVTNACLSLSHKQQQSLLPPHSLSLAFLRDGRQCNGQWLCSVPMVSSYAQWPCSMAVQRLCNGWARQAVQWLCSVVVLSGCAR
ncbi:hypothetical protein ACFX12_037798 [Malus domestica]